MIAGDEAGETLEIISNHIFAKCKYFDGFDRLQFIKPLSLCVKNYQFYNVRIYQLIDGVAMCKSFKILSISKVLIFVFCEITHWFPYFYWQFTFTISFGYLPLCYTTNAYWCVIDFFISYPRFGRKRSFIISMLIAFIASAISVAIPPDNRSGECTY